VPASYRRLAALLRKESVQVLRDPSSLLIAFAMPGILLLLFGYGVSLDAERVPIAIVVEAPSRDAGDLVQAFDTTRYFDARVVLDRRDAMALLDAGEVAGFVVLRADFARHMQDGRGADVQVVVDGVDANNARIVQGYAQGVVETWLAARAREAGRERTLPVRLEPRVWFNPALASRNFLVPGLIAIIMTLTGALLTALVVAREWERGTMEALLATPATVGEIILGKLLPYFFLGMGAMLVATIVALGPFGVPLRGSIAVLTLVSALYMMVVLAWGLLLSTIAKSQFVAAQIAIVTAFLPAFMLSGFLFDIGSMPRILQLLAAALPATWLVSALQTIFLAGDIWPVIGRDAAVLAGMAVLLLAVTRRKLRKSLE
jgi:ABC-2 type transport system permease protein